MSLSADCVRISGLRLNFIRRRLALARFIRCVGANLAQVLLAFVSFAQVLFAPDVVCVRAAADFVKFYKKGKDAKFRKITKKTGL